ncbi:MAG: hypothetical protein MOGDAGHF_00722 [Rhodocyclaceae bacterium]|nr:hypothetical protein [Rhodocyclaceae bacterium]
MTTQSLSRNFLAVPLVEFRHATKVFARRGTHLSQALLAFEDGFLSIESGEATAVMRAEGEWHGRATFSPEILRALAKVPPAQDPIPVSYADGHLLIGGMTIPCYWQRTSRDFLFNLENPGLLDLLALGRTLPRVDIRGSELGRQIRNAQASAARRIRRAATQLAPFDIPESAVRDLVEARIASRLEQGK